MDAAIGVPVATAAFPPQPRHSLGPLSRVLKPGRNYAVTPTAPSLVLPSGLFSCHNGSNIRRNQAVLGPARKLSTRSTPQAFLHGVISSCERLSTVPSIIRIQGGNEVGHDCGGSPECELHRSGGGGDSSGGGGDGGSNGIKTGGNGGDDGTNYNPNHPPYVPNLRLVLIGGAAAAVWASLLMPPMAVARSAVSAPPASTPDVGSNHPVVPTSLLAATPLNTTAGKSGRPTAGSDSSSWPLDSSAADQNPQQRLKRLMREAFADLTEMRLRLEALETAGAATADAEALVVPLEGFAVRPVSRALAPGLQLRCSAQVSGTVDVPFIAPLAAIDQRPDSATVHNASQLALSPAPEAVTATTVTAPASSAGSGGVGVGLTGDLPSWDALIAEAGLCSAQQLRLRIQSVWGQNRPSVADNATAAAALAPLSRRGGAGLGGEGAGAQEIEERPVAAHLQLATEPGGRHVEIDKLLLKAEAHPRLRLLLACRGALENIAKNVNPFAVGTGLQRGLTEAMRRGHDLTLLSDGGAGAAVAATAGDLSLAVGAFSGYPPPIASSGGGGDGLGDITTFAPATATTSCAQLSLHRSRRMALSALWSNSAIFGDEGAGTNLLPVAPSLEGMDLDARTVEGVCRSSQGRLVQRGLVAAAQLTERITAAAWVGDALVPRHAPGLHDGSTRATPALGASTAGVGDGPWATEAAPQAPPQEQEQRMRWRERRVGIRLATLPDIDTGRSVAFCVSHRRMAQGNRLKVGVESESGSLLVAELSAALPLAHGVMLTPGLVLLRWNAESSSGMARAATAGPGAGASRTLLITTAQTTWSF